MIVVPRSPSMPTLNRVPAQAKSSRLHSTAPAAIAHRTPGILVLQSPLGSNKKSIAQSASDSQLLLASSTRTTRGSKQPTDANEVQNSSSELSKSVPFPSHRSTSPQKQRSRRASVGHSRLNEEGSSRHTRKPPAEKRLRRAKSQQAVDEAAAATTGSTTSRPMSSPRRKAPSKFTLPASSLSSFSKPIPKVAPTKASEPLRHSLSRQPFSKSTPSLTEPPLVSDAHTFSKRSSRRIRDVQNRAVSAANDHQEVIAGDGVPSDNSRLAVPVPNLRRHSDNLTQRERPATPEFEAKSPFITYTPPRPVRPSRHIRTPSLPFVKPEGQYRGLSTSCDSASIFDHFANSTFQNSPLPDALPKPRFLGERGSSNATNEGVYSDSS